MFSFFKKLLYKPQYRLIILFSFVLWFGVSWISKADLMSEVFTPAYNNQTIITISKNRDTAGKWFFEWGNQVDIDISKLVEWISEEALALGTAAAIAAAGAGPVALDPTIQTALADPAVQTALAAYLSYTSTEYLGNAAEILDDAVKINAERESSLIVRLTSYFLKLVIAISITMILYNGMMYIIETWNGKEWKSLVKNVVYIVVWILIALFSVVIITIIQSAWTSINKEKPRSSIPQEQAFLNNKVENLSLWYIW